MTNISIRKGDLGRLLIVTGILDTQSSKSLFDTMEEQYKECNCDMYLDLKNVKQLTSTTIGFLVRFNSMLKADEKSLYIYNVQPKIMNLFFHTNISKHITNLFEEVDTPNNYFN